MSSAQALIIIPRAIGVHNMLSTYKCVHDRFCVMVSIILDIDWMEQFTIEIYKKQYFYYSREKSLKSQI